MGRVLACPKRSDVHAAEEVHAVDTDRRVILDAQIDVFADAEAEVASLGEVALAELVLLDLEATLEDLLGLGTADGDVDSDLLVSPNAEGTDSVTGLACDADRVSVPRNFDVFPGEGRCVL